MKRAEASANRSESRLTAALAGFHRDDLAPRVVHELTLPSSVLERLAGPAQRSTQPSMTTPTLSSNQRSPCSARGRPPNTPRHGFMDTANAREGRPKNTTAPVGRAIGLWGITGRLRPSVTGLEGKKQRRRGVNKKQNKHLGCSTLEPVSIGLHDIL